MKSHTLIGGAAASGALTLWHASVAVALTSATNPAATTTTTAASGENTPLHLSSSNLGAHTSGGSTGSTLVRTIVGLFIVIAVIYGVSWILRQAKRGSSRRASGSGLRPVATLPLGSGRSLQLVRAGSDFLLLGVADSGVTPIRTYTEAEALAAGLDLGQLDGAAADAGPSMAEERPGGRVIDALRRMTIRS